MALGLSGSAWAGQDNTNQAPKELRLELNLIDGSRTIGVPTIESVPIQTSYAKMDVPLKQVLAIKVDENRETASIDLCNGDKLKGVVSLAPIKLRTIFGDMAISIEHVRDSRILLTRPPHSPTPVRVLTVSDAAGAEANSCSMVIGCLSKKRIPINATASGQACGIGSLRRCGRARCLRCPRGRRWCARFSGCGHGRGRRGSDFPSPCAGGFRRQC